MSNVIKAIVLSSISFALAGSIAQTATNSKRLSPVLHLVEQNQSEPVDRTDFVNQRQTRYSTRDESLNRLQEFFQRGLKATEIRFQGQSGGVAGFGAGDAYPQIWLRDSATVIPVSRYYYSSAHLVSWLEEHLFYQSDDGSLNDWVASGDRTQFVAGAPKTKEVYRARSRALKPIVISADKNTTEADQETSAVNAAYEIFQIIGDSRWLRKKLKRESIVRRLDRSLMYLIRARFDHRHGLITNAFTADWGDVSPVYPDQRSIYLDDKTPVVAALYTNVLFYRAAIQLREIYLALNQPGRAAYWQEKAAAVKRNMNRYLWQQDRGFYRVHLELTPFSKTAHDESNIFAMGGNALAVLYSVADDAQSARIFEVAERLQAKFGFSTIAGVLLPPYPRGFFQHPAVNEEYKYQNGGQWDWFAGRFLLAEFERGHSRQAQHQLVELAAKAVSNNGLYEWHTRDGKGMGSANYVGSAGALAGAVFQGLYGIYQRYNVLDLRIRLGDRSAELHLYEPATAKFINYRYGYQRESETLTLTYESNSPGMGRICMLLPQNRQPSDLIVDGKRERYSIEVIGQDTYGCLSTDWKRHQVELQTRAASVGSRITARHVNRT
ncbi:MAG TPA: amylo-alpha-1,6-glucosidase [Pyrinomonadaceae bacterium]|nr:amylo-alpha-1,6-glucosidase [Pyrinomonadaceae bacterium]